MPSPAVSKIKPKALRPGDVLAITSPSSHLDPDRMARGCALLESRGYRIKFGKYLDREHGYLAGSDEERAEDLMAAFDDPEVSAVMCARGGFGAARLFPYLDLDRMASSGKMFLGFSDVTTLHIALNQRGLVTFHTPMPITLSYDRVPWVHESFFNLLQGNPNPPAEARRAETIVPGIAEGDVTGGCLCLLCDTIGTANPLDTRGKIIVIEDVDEPPQRIDAMFTHLINTGLLQQCAGIAVGEMTNTDDKVDPTMGGIPWREIIEDRVKPLGIPSVVNFPFGHMKTMLSLPLGIRGRLDANEGVLTFLESPCEG